MMDMESSVKEEDGDGDGCGGGSSNGSVNGSTEGGHSGNGSGDASPRSSPISSLRGSGEAAESSWGDTVEFSENGEPKVGHGC